MDFDERVRAHAALGDPHRLRVVDALWLSDLTFSEVAEVAALPGNALAHHLDVLEEAGLVSRHRSEGDGRRRYVHLETSRLAGLSRASARSAESLLFVCTHNSARSQFAAALWEAATGEAAESAGSEPGARVQPKAVAVAAEHDLDLTGKTPRGYADVTGTPDLVISVCDRARESGTPDGIASLHWSVADPVRTGTSAAFRAAFREIQARVEQLAASTKAAI